MKQTAHLEQWSVGFNEQLFGIVTGHPQLTNGMPIFTSRIVKLDKENKTCETLNTIYTLGEQKDD